MTKRKMPGRGNSGKGSEKRASDAEKKYWLEERKAFNRKYPKSARQRDVVENIVNWLAKPSSKWRKARNKATKTWLELETYLLDLGRQGKKPDSNKFRRLVEKAQKASRNSIECEQDFFNSRRILERNFNGRIDFDALNRILELHYVKTGAKIELAFYGNISLLADARLLSSFAKLVGRLRLGKDKKYENRRQSVADYAVALEATVQQISRMNAERDARLHAGRTSRRQWFVESLIERLIIVQQAGNLAEAEQSLYSHMKTYAKSKRLTKFLEMLEREKRAEKNRMRSNESGLDNAIRELKGKGKK